MKFVYVIARVMRNGFVHMYERALRLARVPIGNCSVLFICVFVNNVINIIYINMTRVDDVGSSCSMCGNSNSNVLGDKETFESSTMHSHSWLVSFVSEIEMVVNEFVNEYKCDMEDTVFVSFNDVLMLIKKTIQVIGDVNVNANVNGMNVYYAYLNELLMKGIKKCEEHKEEEACNDKVDDDDDGNDHSHLVLSNQNIIDKISKKISMAIHKKKMNNVITCNNNNNNQLIRSLSQTKMNSYSLKYKDKLAKKRSGMGSVVKRNDTYKRRISEEKEKEKGKEKKNVITMELENEFNYNYKKRIEVKLFQKLK